MHREMHSGQDKGKERPRIRARARTEKNQRQRLTEIHTAIDLGKGRDRRETQRSRDAERLPQRDDTKYRETEGSGAGRHW